MRPSQDTYSPSFAFFTALSIVLTLSLSAFGAESFRSPFTPYAENYPIRSRACDSLLWNTRPLTAEDRHHMGLLISLLHPNLLIIKPRRPKSPWLFEHIYEFSAPRPYQDPKFLNWFSSLIYALKPHSETEMIELLQHLYESITTNPFSGPQAQSKGIAYGESVFDQIFPVRRDLGIELNSHLRRIPLAMRLTVLLAKRPVDIVHGSITNHPIMIQLRGVRPRGWDAGSTWDSVPGAAGVAYHSPLILNGNSLYDGHGSHNLLIHEYAHLFDRAVAELYGGIRISESPEWLSVHNTTKWASEYEANHPEEAFAEAVARFFGDPQGVTITRDRYPNVSNNFHGQLLNGSRNAMGP